MNSVNNLIEIGTVVDQHGDDALAIWWRESIADFLSGISLEDALQLRAAGPGKSSARYQFLLGQRDWHLRSAWQLLRHDTHTDWSASEQLAKEFSRFERVWPNVRHIPKPPQRLTELQRHLFEIFRLPVARPDTRRIHDLCSETSFSLHKPSASISS